MDKLAILKQLRNIQDNSKDSMLEFALEYAQNAIKNYCGIENIPHQLDNVIVKIADEIYTLNGYGKTDSPTIVKSVTQGSRSISYETPDYGTDILKKYAAQLKRFKNRKGKLPSNV